jgi:hypothetical protein
VLQLKHGRLCFACTSCLDGKAYFRNVVLVLEAVSLVDRNDDNLCIVAVGIGTFHGACDLGREGHAVPYAVDCLALEFHNLIIPVNFYKFGGDTETFSKCLCHVRVKSNPFSIFVLVVHRFKIGDADNQSALAFDVVKVGCIILGGNRVRGCAGFRFCIFRRRNSVAAIFLCVRCGAIRG